MLVWVVLVVRFPVAGSMVYDVQYGAAPPRPATDRVVVQSVFGVHASVRLCRVS